MARSTSANYTNFAFQWGTVAADPFKKEDVQLLGQAVEAHDHTTGKGLAVGRLAAGCLATTLVSGAGTSTLPTVSDTLVGKATTDNLTNKTITAAVFAGSHTGATFTVTAAGVTALDLQATTADLSNSGRKLRMDTGGNLILSADVNAGVQTMTRGIFLGAAAGVLPAGNPAAGFYIYVDSTTLKCRGTAGTITTLAVA